MTLVDGFQGGERDLLAEKLEQIHKASSGFHVSLPESGVFASLRYNWRLAYIEALNALGEFSKSVAELVVADDRFFGEEQRMIYQLNGASPFYPRSVAHLLVLKTLEFGSSIGAIAWLQKVIKTEAADGCYITVLWNVPVESEVQLTPEMKLIPFDGLPESEQKKSLEKFSFENDRIFTSLNWDKPSSAIVFKYRVDPFFYDPGQPFRGNKDFSRIYDLVSKATLALTLVGPRVPICAANWFSFDDPELEFAVYGKKSGSPLIEVLPREFQEEPMNLDAADAQSVVAQYLSLSEQSREKVATAISRLQQALIRHVVGDRAVELSIALEALMGDDSSGEITHKMTVRAVRLLGGSPETRARNHTILREVYKIRSKLVHGGRQVPKEKSISIGKNERLSADDLISEGCKLCTELIRGILARNSLPQWSHFDINDH